ncbi:MAG: glucosamine-6-phosphate deaminase [Clostridia bacterium]|nr:glucosamine-6-phosphate deaminase [Clostridia bacterium]
MRTVVCKNSREMSEKAAKMIESQVILAPSCVLGLPTGETPVETYRLLSEACEKGEVDFSGVKTYNLDEYYPMSPENAHSYRYFMEQNLFSRVNVKKENTHVLNGEAEDPDAECAAFEEMIEKDGGIDLQVLGIGENGHIGFNEPGASLYARTHLTTLTQSTRNANSRFFGSVSEVPERALTMGIGTVLKSKKILILASGAKKHKAVRRLLSGEVDTDYPATLLNLHSDVTLICDEAAFSSERIGVDIGGTNVKLCVLNDANETVFKTAVKTPGGSREDLLKLICGKCLEIMKERNIDAVGVGTPGIIENGLVTAVNLPFYKTDLCKEIGDALGLPVRVSNDASCAALAEKTCGAAKGFDNAVLLSLGTGVGGGLILGGRLYEGRGSAGEAGHFVLRAGGRKCACGKRGCFEQYASAGALARAAKKEAQKAPQSVLARLILENGGKAGGEIIKKAADAGCPSALAAIDAYSRSLALGIDGLAALLDPDVFVLSGGVSLLGDALINSVKKHIKCGLPVKRALLGNDAGAVGAALLQ